MLNDHALSIYTTNLLYFSTKEKYKGLNLYTPKKQNKGYNVLINRTLCQLLIRNCQIP
jgi:cytochrome oxidase assembly protein ShyY1